MKSSNSDAISIVAYSYTKHSSREKAIALNCLLNNYEMPILSYDVAERTRHKYSNEEAFADYWVEVDRKGNSFSTVFIKGKDYYCSPGYGGSFPYAMSIHRKMKGKWDVSAVISLCIDFFTWSEAFYGYACRETQPNMMMDSPTLQRCLPIITWANYFGKPYIDMWGENNIQNAPAFSIQKTDNNNYLIIASEDPQMELSEAIPQQELIMDYFGRKHFVSNVLESKIWPNGSVHTRYVHKHPSYNYVAPDFRKYYDIPEKLNIEYDLPVDDDYWVKYNENRK